VEPPTIESKEALVSTMKVDSARPQLRIENEGVEDSSGDEPFDSWVETLIRLLQLWV
jgi:hypothetical protein